MSTQKCHTLNKSGKNDGMVPATKLINHINLTPTEANMVFSIFRCVKNPGKDIDWNRAAELSQQYKNGDSMQTRYRQLEKKYQLGLSLSGMLKRTPDTARAAQAADEEEAEYEDYGEEEEEEEVERGFAFNDNQPRKKQKTATDPFDASSGEREQYQASMRAAHAGNYTSSGFANPHALQNHSPYNQNPAYSTPTAQTTSHGYAMLGTSHQGSEMPRAHPQKLSHKDCYLQEPEQQQARDQHIQSSQNGLDVVTGEQNQDWGTRTASRHLHSRGGRRLDHYGDSFNQQGSHQTGQTGRSFNPQRGWQSKQNDGLAIQHNGQLNQGRAQFNQRGGQLDLRDTLLCPHNGQIGQLIGQLAQPGDRQHEHNGMSFNQNIGQHNQGQAQSNQHDGRAGLRGDSLSQKESQIDQPSEQLENQGGHQSEQNGSLLHQHDSQLHQGRTQPTQQNFQSGLRDDLIQSQIDQLIAMQQLNQARQHSGQFDESRQHRDEPRQGLDLSPHDQNRPPTSSSQRSRGHMSTQELTPARGMGLPPGPAPIANMGGDQPERRPSRGYSSVPPTVSPGRMEHPNSIHPTRGLGSIGTERSRANTPQGAGSRGRGGRNPPMNPRIANIQSQAGYHVNMTTYGSSEEEEESV